jgi:hypothetical protein
MRSKLNKFDLGLFLSGPADRLTEGYMRRFRGISPLAQYSAPSRDGGTQIHALNAHSLFYWDGTWYSGVTTTFYSGTDSKKTGLNGDRLAFAVTLPVAGYKNSYLFCAGGGELFKISPDGLVSDWGIARPLSVPTATQGSAGGSLTADADYKYAVTYRNSVTGTRSNPGYLTADYTTVNFVVLMHFEGTHGSTTMTNSITGGPSFTAQGGLITQNNAHFGDSSLICTPSGSDYIKAADDADFHLSADFTISFWYRSAQVTDKYGIFGQYSSAATYVTFTYDLTIGIFAAVEIEFMVKSASATIVNLTATIPSSPSFRHFEITRSGNDWALFIDGALVDSTTNANAYPNVAAEFNIGRGYDADIAGWAYADGNIDEFTIVKGTALHTTDFAPPEGPYINDAGASSDDTNLQIDLTDIPQPDDDQVDEIELWRTIGDGAVYFKLTSLAVGTTTYTDGAADTALRSEELPIDNHKPYRWLDDCYGPWQGAMWWLTRGEDGAKGKLFFSPVGRAEAMRGFIEITSEEDGLQKIVGYAGNLFVLSKYRAFQVYGDYPYQWREVPGVPGTNAPHTVAVTPFGPMWESQDGVRGFIGGVQAELVSYNAVKPIFRGHAVENLTAFTGTVATYARGEYIISNGTSTLAYNIERKVWRDLGVGCNALAYSATSDQIAAVFSSKIVNFEKEGDTADAGANITYDLQTGETNFGDVTALEFLRIDANANTETLTVYGIFDGTSTSKGTLTTTAGRRFTEIDLSGQLVERFATRITGTINAAVEVYEIQLEHRTVTLDLYVDKQRIRIPGRFVSNKGEIHFELFPELEQSLQTTYIMERLQYDLNTANQVLTLTLYTISETGTETATALGTIQNNTRTVSELPIAKTGSFLNLKIAGTLTAALTIRRLEMVCTSARATA